MSHHSAIDIQLAARFKLPRGFEPTSDLVREAIDYRIEHGRNPDRIQLRLIGWRSGRKFHSARGGEREAWHRLGRILQSATYTVRWTIRRPERTSE